MDNNLIFQLQLIEHEQENKIRKLNKVTSVKKDFKKNKHDFKSIYKKELEALREKRKNILNDDVIVDDSLKEILKYNKEVKEVINKKLSTSNILIKALKDSTESPDSNEKVLGGIKDED